MEKSRLPTHIVYLWGLGKLESGQRAATVTPIGSRQGAQATLARTGVMPKYHALFGTYGSLDFSTLKSREHRPIIGASR